MREWKNQALAVFRDYDERSRYILYGSLALNLIYSLLKLMTGIWFRDLWFIALGCYYAVLALLRFSLLRSIRDKQPGSGGSAYRRTAVLLNLLTIVMAGIFALVVMRNARFDYPGVWIYAMAVYAFARMITATINLLKRRGDENNSLAAARCVSFCGALMSIQALQTALLGRYGSDGFAVRMNTIVGLVIVLMMIGLCVVMLKNTDRMTMKKKDSR